MSNPFDRDYKPILDHSSLSTRANSVSATRGLDAARKEGRGWGKGTIRNLGVKKGKKGAGSTQLP